MGTSQGPPEVTRHKKSKPRETLNFDCRAWSSLRVHDSNTKVINRNDRNPRLLGKSMGYHKGTLMNV